MENLNIHRFLNPINRLNKIWRKFVGFLLITKNESNDSYATIPETILTRCRTDKYSRALLSLQIPPSLGVERKNIAFVEKNRIKKECRKFENILTVWMQETFWLWFHAYFSDGEYVYNIIDRPSRRIRSSFCRYCHTASM